ncbi:MAG: ATP-binding protein [Gemmatimonadota bacterium]
MTGGPYRVDLALTPIDPAFRQRVISEFTADWQFWIREDGSLEYMTADCQSVSGWSRGDFFAGRVRLKDYVHPDDYQTIRGHYHAAAAGGEGRDIEFRLVRRDGGVVWCSVSYVPIRDETGRSWGFRGSVRDIDRRKEAEQSALRERNILDRAVSSIGGGLTLLDRSRRIVWYNAHTAGDMGPLAENRGRPCYTVFEGRDAACPDCPIEVALATGKAARTEKTGVRVPGGAVRDVAIIAVPVEGVGDGDGACLEIVLDITEARREALEKERLREQLIRSQKMEALGELAGGIAHEFNNYIGAILGVASALQMQRDAGGALGPQIDLIGKSASRASELTKQLLGFARRGRPDVREVRPNEVVSAVLSIVRQTFGRGIEVRHDLDDGVWNVMGDPGQLEQTLMNICINARDAMPSGGALTVSTRNVELGDRRLRPASGEALPPGPYVLLTVEDSGTGIVPEIRERIFEPFFTTKEPGKGTGMGLALAYGIVRSHGGSIDVESAPGRGTVFRVCLPARRP